MTVSGPRPMFDDSTGIPPPVVHVRTGAGTLDACAVSVGNFDGVHLGHAALVGRLRDVAASRGVPAVVLTFDPHPASLVRPDAAPVPLTTVERRVELLLALGLDAVVVQPVTPLVLRLSPRRFYDCVLRERLHAVAIVEGPDFRFGVGRSGDNEVLRGFCGADDVRLDVLAPLEVGAEPVSSSRVRRLIATGDVATANRLLSAPYRVSGRVVPGARRGATLGFPTANLDGIATLLPAPGVYAARASATPCDAAPHVEHAAAVHVGPNATFGETSLSVEAHLIGFAGDLYGRTLHVDFLTRLRETHRFDSVEELCAQLALDVSAAAAAGSAAGGASPPPEPPLVPPSAA